MRRPPTYAVYRNTNEVSITPVIVKNKMNCTTKSTRGCILSVRRLFFIRHDGDCPMLEISYKHQGNGMIDVRTPIVEIHPNRAAPVSLIIDTTGVSVSREGDIRVLTWADLVRLHEDGVPEPCRWGVVVNGELVEVYTKRATANDRQTEHRAQGSKVRIIKMQAEPM